MAISSTEIEVSWEEVPAINENGIITVYEVQYVPLQTFGDQISTNTTNTTYLNTTLTGLQEYVEYSISVRAYTSVGPGPYSDTVTERTLEDGELEEHCLCQSFLFLVTLQISLLLLSCVSHFSASWLSSEHHCHHTGPSHDQCELGHLP